MANYNSNYEIAQEISARLGTEPIPFESVYGLCLEIYEELGGTEQEFNDVYSILLSILPLTHLIDDSVTASGTTWSSSKISSEISNNTLSAGQNITIASNSISADGYIFDKTSGSTVTIYKQDESDGGQLLSNTATGLGSIAEGYNTTATGDYGSHAEGCDTKATVDCTHAEGYATQAIADSAHAEGIRTVAAGQGAHAEGYGASNMAYRNVALGDGSHVEGCCTKAFNKAEHAEGFTNISHTVQNSEWGNSGNTLSSIGMSKTMNLPKNAVEVMQNGDIYINGIGDYDGVHIKSETGYENTKTLQEVINNQQSTLTAGDNILISGNTISAVGYSFNSSGGFATNYMDNGSAASNTASANGAHAEGQITVASDECTHAEGYDTTASVFGAHSEGYYTTASNYAAHAEGCASPTERNEAAGWASHVEGMYSYATGQGAHAEGYGNPSYKCRALADGAHAEGCSNLAQNKGEHAGGCSNVSHKASDTFGNAGNTLRSIGNGNAANVRQNALELMQNGDLYLTGVGNYDGVHIKGETGAPANLQTLQEYIAALEARIAALEARV